MIEKNCGNCTHYQAIAAEVGQSPRGECRYNPPTIFILPAKHGFTGEQIVMAQPMFPQVGSESWCGKFTASYGASGVIQQGN